MKKFYKKTGRKLQFDAKEPVRFDKTKVECFNFHNTWHFARECGSKGNQESRRKDAGNTIYKAKDNERRPGKQEEPKALVTLDGDDVDWTGHAEDEQENFASMAYSNLGSDNEMSDKDKSGLGYGDQIHEGVLSYENEVRESVFDSRSSDVEDSPVYDRFAKVEGMHVVPPLMTGIYMPPKSDFGIDESNVETLESVPKPVVNEPSVVSKPKVWFDALIIDEYESDSDGEYVIKPSKEQEKPSFAFLNTVKHVKTPRETIKEQNTCNPIPKADKTDWNDCDFYEKRMAKQVELNKQKGKGTGQGENRPMWTNVQRLNHQNKFVPKVVLTKTGRFPVNAARQTLSSKAVATSTARKVNTARPIVNEIRPRNNFYKSHSSIRRPFNRTTAPKANFTNHKVNTVGDKTVSAIGGNRETAVKASTGCNWRSKRHYWNKVSKYNSRSNSSKNVNFKDPLGRPKSAMAWNSAVSQTVNNVSQIKATISGQTVLISKSSIRIDLLFNDDNGIDCLTVADIYENLPLMGSKSTSWDQFPTNVISAVICLDTDRTFNFSKMIFDGMNRNLEAKKKFLMYPRFVQVFLNNHLQNIPAPLDNLPILVLSKKVFTNMTRIGLHFSGHVTPLFPTMLVPIAVQEGEGSGTHIKPQPTPSPTQPSVSDQTHVTESSSRPENTQNSRNTLEGTGGSEGDQVQLPYDSPLSGGHTSDSAEGGLNLEELFVLCTNLSSRVLALETSKDAQAIEIL
ncbi:hypothetical protein Tco_0828307 [Tanacetum coccineum]